VSGRAGKEKAGFGRRFGLDDDGKEDGGDGML
jgi:hypothetical protein